MFLSAILASHFSWLVKWRKGSSEKGQGRRGDFSGQTCDGIVHPSESEGEFKCA